MKNKGFLLSLFIAGSLTANAQDIKEWLSLTPIKMEKPALSHVKNVKDHILISPSNGQTTIWQI